MIRELFCFPELLVCRYVNRRGRQRVLAISAAGRVLWRFDPLQLHDPIVRIHGTSEVLVAGLQSGSQCILDPFSGELSAPIFEAFASRGRPPLIVVTEIAASG